MNISGMDNVIVGCWVVSDLVKARKTLAGFSPPDRAFALFLTVALVPVAPFLAFML